MTLEQLNIALHKLAAQPQREHVIEFSFALMEWMGIEPNSGKTPQLIAPKTQKLKEYLAPAPQTVQPQLYRLSADNQTIRVRFSVLKKLKKEYITQLVDNDPGAESFQNTPDALKTVTKAPYFIHFVTTTDYDRLVLIFNQGDQKKVVTLKNRLSNTQYLKVIQKWQSLAIKSKPEVASLFWKSLDLNEVNKEFYIKIKERFDGLLGIMLERKPDLSEKDLKMFAIRLIGRYIFCWFLKEKEIIHADLISSDALGKYEERYNKILKPLFFETLNTFPYPERKYSNDLPEELHKYLIEIPYLNGGLFEPSVEDDLIPEISIDDWLLSFVKLLEQYSFTVDESSPAYEQVAIDPEMLGKILENLLASLNPETEKLANERNALGAFYTPRPIVDYMVTESLKVYFESQLTDEEKKVEPSDNFFTTNNGKQTLFSSLEPKQMAFDINKMQQPPEVKEKLRSKIDKLFDYSIDQNPFNAEETRKLKTALINVKIIDPACGSGAFPMGVLHKLEMLHEKLGTDKSPVDLRRTILSQNIFGIDILPMAVEISRLRAWLALVLVSDYKRADKKHNFNIKALPNLDFKFVCANTLIGVPENEYVDLMAAADLKLFEELTEKYFSSYTEEKEKLKDEIQICIDNITSNHERAIERYVSELKKHQNSASPQKLKKMREELAVYEKQKKQWHSYKNMFAHGSVDFFDTKYFFPSVKHGFDIVIGNPPYVQLQKDSGKLANQLKDEGYSTFERTGDVYAIFYEHGFKILKEKGIVTFITSSQWSKANYGKSLREFFLSKNPLKLIALGPGVFESAVVDTNIIIIRNEKNNNQLYSFTIDKREQLTRLNSFIFKPMPYVTKENWAILSDSKQAINEKIKANGKALKEWDIHINRGILTGLNEAFIIDNLKRDELIEVDRKSDEIIVPILRGREIEKYFTAWEKIYLINSHNGSKRLKIDKIDIKKYPAVKQHLDLFKKQLVARADQGDTFYNLRNCAYLNEFSKEKVIWKRIGSQLRFSYFAKPLYCLDSTCFATGEKIKYLTALLNSKLCNHQLFENSPKTGMGDLIISVQALEPLLVYYPNNLEERQITSIVDKILEAKSLNLQADTSKQENQIDIMVYHLYGLTYDEAKIIDPALSEEEFNKYKIKTLISS